MLTGPQNSAAAVQAGLESTRRRIVAAATEAHRDPASVTLLAVSKQQPADAVRAAFETMWRRVGKAMPKAQIDGLLVRPMIPGGYEVILGAKRDPAFGPTVMFGLGGIYVELFRDVTFGLAPLDRHTAARMVHQVKACQLLEGARGGVCSDIEGIQQCLVRVGQLISDFDRILELDVNPLIAGPAETGNMVADVRIRLDGTK